VSDTILLSINGPIAKLVLNNPERHNSLGAAELKGLSGALSIIESNCELRVLVITGAGDKTFCGGASLVDMRNGAITGDDFQSVTDQISKLTIPTIAALNGSVFGGGAELALSCDFRIGVEGMILRVPPATMGLCYPISGIETFTRKLGPNISKRLLLAAEKVEGEALVNMGFLDSLVGRSDLPAATQSYAEQLAANAPLSVQGMKKIIDAIVENSLDREEAKVIADQCWNSDDLKEGLSAQKEKREPLFRGR